MYDKRVPAQTTLRPNLHPGLPEVLCRGDLALVSLWRESLGDSWGYGEAASVVIRMSTKVPRMNSNR
jgi:hypothetical protein